MTVAEFNQAVDLFSDVLYRFALKMLEDTDDAQDIVQEVFLRVWEKRDQIEGTKIKSYLFTATHHLCIDFIRKSKQTQSLDDMLDEPFSETQYQIGLKNLLDLILKQMPPVLRAVLMLRDYEGCSYEEIGLITGLSESQVKVYIYRARLYVKKRIEKLEHVI